MTAREDFRIPGPPGDWMADAACIGINPDLFFPERGHPNNNQEAKAICARCPVRDDCLNYALTEHIVHGIWGGTSEKERRHLRRLRRKDAA